MMRRLLCRILKHKWVLAWSGGPHAKALDAMRCTRCNEMGWQT